jgi:hypothetical protein
MHRYTVGRQARLRAPITDSTGPMRSTGADPAEIIGNGAKGGAGSARDSHLRLSEGFKRMGWSRSARGEGPARLRGRKDPCFVLCLPQHLQALANALDVTGFVLSSAALANKLTRIAWSVLYHGRGYEPRIGVELA